ncbi:MAG: AbrB/MazE/SpoVT family DNA-binding domain-containing protein [Terracidiphilus sp.]
MKFAKWGNSVAIRVPAKVVAELGISPDEEAQIRVTGEYSFEVTRDRRREEAIEAIRKLARPLPPGYKFNRDEIYDRYERGVMRRQESSLESNPESNREQDAR